MNRTAVVAWFILLTSEIALGAAIGPDGRLVGQIDRPPPPCFGESCYIPCQQAFDAQNNTSAAAQSCLQNCMLNNAGGGSQGGYPGAFMGACMSCAGTNVNAAIQLGVYATCVAAENLGGNVAGAVVDLTGCGEPPAACSNPMQGVAKGISAVIGEPVKVLRTQSEVDAYNAAENKKQKK